MTAGIAVFVKTPGRSPIKTRLAVSLGRDIAEGWHRRAAGCVADAAAASGHPVYWAVAESEAMSDPLWRDRPRIPQGPGGLGRRMARVHAELVARHGAGILVGADLPQLDPAELGFAGEWLLAEEERFVLGPARDGGFWLFGANRTIDLPAWESVDYSRDDTARAFVESIGGDRWRRLATRTDLDESRDIEPVLAELRALPRPRPGQLRLADWLERLVADRVASDPENRE